MPGPALLESVLFLSKEHWAFGCFRCGTRVQSEIELGMERIEYLGWRRPMSPVAVVTAIVLGPDASEEGRIVARGYGSSVAYVP